MALIMLCAEIVWGQHGVLLQMETRGGQKTGEVTSFNIVNGISTGDNLVLSNFLDNNYPVLK